MTRVSVVVLTHDRVDGVLRTLERLTALPERPPIVVVDNASRDGTAAAVRARFPAVEVVRLDDNRGAAGRNAGMARVRTPYVAFCDDDTWWTPGSLARAAGLLDAHAALALVTGCVLVGPDQRLDPACAEMANSPLPPVAGLPGRPVLGFLAAATMARRQALLAVGGFEPRFFLGGEEELIAVDLAAAGWALAYVSEIVVHHHPSARRDAAARRRLLVRNALWCAWLRRPPCEAWRHTLRIMRTGRVRGGAPGMAAALVGLVWVLRHRTVVPPEVVHALRRLDEGSGHREPSPAARRAG